jgi:hypothetical protein
MACCQATGGGVEGRGRRGGGDVADGEGTRVYIQSVYTCVYVRILYSPKTS